MSDNTPHTHQKVHAFLRHHPMAVLSTVSADGHPWGAAIYYVADEEFKFYFVTRKETFKYQNLEEHPYAAITIADPDTQTTVQASGRIERLPAERYMDIVFNKLAKLKIQSEDPHWMPPLSKIHKGDYMPLYLVPDRLQFADYKHKKADIDADYIETII